MGGQFAQPGQHMDLPVSFGRLHVLPILNDFMRKWPEISVSASFNDRYVDLIDEGVDFRQTGSAGR